MLHCSRVTLLRARAIRSASADNVPSESNTSCFPNQRLDAFSTTKLGASTSTGRPEREAAPAADGNTR
jgi:hypothetical protein